MSDPVNASVNHPLPLADVPGWDAMADVLIVGYGAAGACAALEAARAGARVCIVEASGAHGGASALRGRPGLCFGSDSSSVDVLATDAGESAPTSSRRVRPPGP